MLYYTLTPARPRFDYIQQQRELAQRAALKRQMLRELNTPELSFSQDARGYTLVLNKRPSAFTNSITGNYKMRVVGRELVISSTIDDYYRAITLPRDSQGPISYSARRFAMEVVIPRRHYVSSSHPSSLVFLSASVEDVAQAVQEDREDTECCGADEDSYSSYDRTFVCDSEADCGARRVESGNASEVSDSPIEDRVPTKHQEQADACSLNNYETSRRRTVFAPNESGFVEETDTTTEGQLISEPTVEPAGSPAGEASGEPLTAVRSPMVEDLVDEEFA